MKAQYLLLITVATGLAAAQEGPQVDNPLSTKPVTLVSQFFENNNYFNYFAFASGVYDSFAPSLNNAGQSVNTGGFGYTIGGGASAYHSFRHATLDFTYSGNYRDYSSPLFTSGTDQNLALSYTRRLSRRWSLNTSIGAGTVLYGTGYVGNSSNSVDQVSLNPFSASTRYLSSGVSLAYQQSRRLSYVVSGNFFLQRYTAVNAVGTTGGSGSGSVNYRTTARTTVSASYSFSSFTYQRGAGDAQLHTVLGIVSHQFPNHWFVSVSGGISHSQITGVIALPISSLTGNVGAGGYLVGYYNTSSNFPSFSGTVTRVYRRFQLSGSAGQSIVSGNGYYLASRNQFINGNFSKSWRRSNISAGVNWYRLKSAANTVAYTYSSTGIGASYGYQLMRYVSSNFRYDYLHYGNLPPYPAINNNRLSFGFSFSSRSVPLTLY